MASLIKSLLDYIGRWFPNPVEPGLWEIGDPDENSPVLVTSNFHLTVRRVEDSLEGQDCYLLVAPTNGINVWCASTGGDMDTHSIMRIIKTSGISGKVRHRKLILPQFSAPGIDRESLKEKTGWRSVFGPAYAKDIPSFLEDGLKTPDQCIAEFPFGFRLEMLLSMNFLVWVLIGIAMLLLNPDRLLEVSALFWISGMILYAGFPFIPSRSGWVKAVIITIMEISLIAIFSKTLLGMSWWSYWGWMIGVSAINIWLGFDLKGIAGGSPSEAERLLVKHGFESFGGLFSADVKQFGKIQLSQDKCTGCQTCLNVCPKGVYALSKDKNKAVLQNPKQCFFCNACVRQCPEGAIAILSSS